MSTIDRRILRSQEAIKKAFVELMSEKSFDHITIQNIADRANVNRRTIYLHYMDKYDLLDKLIEEHIKKLREICETTSDIDILNGSPGWFEYFKRHYSFFSAMIASKGSPFFRSRFLELVVEDLKNGYHITEGKNRGLSADVILQFFGTACVGAVEWWFKNEMPYPPLVMEEQMLILLDSMEKLPQFSEEGKENT